MQHAAYENWSASVFLKVATLLFSELDPEAIKPATPKVLAIDGFWGKRYNAESDGDQM